MALAAVLASFVLSPSAFCQTKFVSQARQEFEDHLVKGGRSYGFDTKLYPNWEQWSGFSSQEGMAVITEELTRSSDPSRRELAFLYLHHPSLSRIVLTAHLLERAKANYQEPPAFIGYIALMEDAEVMEEPGVITYMASHNADIRSIETNPRHPESMAGQTMRVCDFMSGKLCRWMLKKGHLKYGDPSLGDLGGETMWVARNKRIDAVNNVLMKLGLIQNAVRPDDNATTPPPPRTKDLLPKPQATQHRTATQDPSTNPFSYEATRELPDPFASGAPLQTPSIGIWWKLKGVWITAIFGLLLIALIWRFVRK